MHIYLVLAATIATTSAFATEATVFLKPKIDGLTVRSSPGVVSAGGGRKSNDIKTCRLTRADLVRAVDFQFVEGMPWCRARLSQKEGCPSDVDVWFAGDDRFLMPTDVAVAEEHKLPAQKPNSDFCASCFSKSIGTGLIQRPEVPALEFVSPIAFRECAVGAEDCNCSGVVSNHGPRRAPRAKGGRGSHYHLGIDIGAPRGIPIRAVADGVVTLAAWKGGLGNSIEINHFDGSKSPESQLLKDEEQSTVGALEGQNVKVTACGVTRTRTAHSLKSNYAHLSKFESGIKPGKIVKKGEIIGYVGMTGIAEGPHLHFEIEQEGLECDGRQDRGTCDPRYFHAFPEKRANGSRAMFCEGAKK